MGRLRTRRDDGGFALSDAGLRLAGGRMAAWPSTADAPTPPWIAALARAVETAGRSEGLDAFLDGATSAAAASLKAGADGGGDPVHLRGCVEVLDALLIERRAATPSRLPGSTLVLRASSSRVIELKRSPRSRERGAAPLEWDGEIVSRRGHCSPC